MSSPPTNSSQLLQYQQITSQQPHQGPITNFEVNIVKESFKFNAAHFVTFKNFRERLHGHNYSVGVRLLGNRYICSDGYVLDFGDVKKVVKDICSSINEHFLCPMLSDVMDIKISNNIDDAGGEQSNTTSSVHIKCQDGANFVFPREDCILLPIVHSTTEELAIYLWSEILEKLDPSLLLHRGIHTMEITCAEAPGQEALFRKEIKDLLVFEEKKSNPESMPSDTVMMPSSSVDDKLIKMKKLDVRSFIRSGEFTPNPIPCLTKGDQCIYCKKSIG